MWSNKKRSSAFVFKVNSFYFTLLCIFLFFFIYGPPFSFLPLNISLMMAVVCLLFFVRPISLRSLAIFKIEIILLFLICIYALAVSLLANRVVFSDVLIHTPFILLFFNAPLVIFLYRVSLRAFNRNPDFVYDGLVSILVIIGCLSAFISIALWLVPDVNEYVKFEIMKYDRSLLTFQAHRGFGLSDELLFTYSIVQASIFLLAVERFGLSPKTVLLFFLVVISIALNARIGFLFLPLVILLSKFWGRRSVLSILAGALTLVVAVFFLDGLFGRVGSQFIYFVEDLSGTSDASSSRYLFDHMIFFPDSLTGLMFGDGYNVFQGRAKSSDSGYIMMIFFGGVIYTLLIFSLVIYCVFRGVRAGFFMPVAIIGVVFLVSNLKGLFFAPKPGMHLVMVVYVFLVMSHRDSFRKRVVT